MNKKILITFCLICLILCSAYKKPYRYTIDAVKDAYYHNNVGVNYLKDRIYYAAIQEFKIAISLNPNSQASAIYYNNLGETYIYIGYPDLAVDCFENALKLYGLNFQYYQNLVKTYELLGLSNLKIKEIENSKNPYDKIKLGLLYIQKGEKRKGIITLDEFCFEEPDLIITTAIRQHLREITTSVN